MARRNLKRLTAFGISVASLVLGVAAWVSLSSAGPPPPPRPGPGPGLGPGPGPGPRPAVVHPGPKPPVKPRVLARRNPLLVRRVSGKVVVERQGTVVRTVTAPVVVNSVQTLQAVPARQPEAKGPAYKVAKVGDDFTVTLDADGKETPVRLIGVEPAEGEQARGIHKIEARRFFENLLAGEFVYVEQDEGLEAQDEDGVAVGYLYRAPDGLFVNLELVRQGYALGADGYDFQHAKTFEFYENKAQGDRKGIWSPLPPRPGREGGPTTRPLGMDRPPLNRPDRPRPPERPGAQE